MPRHLQSKIHSDYSKISGTWTGYRAEITGLWGLTTNHGDFNNHLIDALRYLAMSRLSIKQKNKGTYTLSFK